MLAVSTVSSPEPTPREAARALLVQALYEDNCAGSVARVREAMDEALRLLTAGPEDACLSVAAQVLSAAKLVSRHDAPAGRVRLAAQTAIEALHLECEFQGATYGSRETKIAVFDISVRRLVNELEALDGLHGPLVRLRGGTP